MTKDPRDILNNEPMKARQVLIVGLCLLLNALDGFDILAITFAAPGIAQDWAVGPEMIGIVISTGLFSMAVGSILLSPITDKVGRRFMVIACLLVMGVGMLLSAFATDIISLCVYRFITGLGIGGILPTINAVSAEFSNEKRRHFSVCMMGIGYAIGGVLGGSAAAFLLSIYSWESVFIFGGVMAFIILPIAWFLMPESIEFLIARKGQGALEQTNKILRQLGHSEADHIRMAEAGTKPAGLSLLFTPRNLPQTVALSVSYFLHVMTLYYVLGWVPTLVTGLGFDKVVGTDVSVWVNIGGMFGGILFGWAATYYDLRKLLVGILLTGGVLVILFGQVPADLVLLKSVGFLVGFCMSGSVIGLYALLAAIYPTTLRATGTGFVVGAGRAGSAIGPVITGFLLAAGATRGETSMIMAMGSIIAGLVLLSPWINRRPVPEMAHKPQPGQ
ncbi:MFS transporter [Emcibacter sp.]|uniref:MFS transporter n=1 Tax=Emcibacter sp. TaxID=1979954 RepID=UPI003A952693